jgi:prophage DNA circulation protein
MSLLGGFQSLLQQAYWRGIPFLVETQQVTKGRKTALHEYPFRDGGWVEDLGRKQRVFRFTGHLVGDSAPIMQLLLDTACELAGPGLLIHPTLGAMNVALMSASSSVHSDKMRVISVEFEFMEQGTSLFPGIISSALSAVVGAVSNALSAFGSAISVAMTAISLVSGAVEIAGATGVTSSFSSACAAAAADPAALVALATALPPPDTNTWYGRYAAGSAVTQLPDATTVVSLQAQMAVQRAAVAAAAAALTAAAVALTALTTQTLVAAMANVVEATRATMSNPADQIRTLLNLATFTVPVVSDGTGLSTDVADLNASLAATCRRCALASLGLASSSYQPLSYEDAAAMRTLVSAALGVEITAAGDAGDDASYGALRALRTAMIEDLTTRGAALPLVMTVTLPTNLPTLVVAYRLYQDASRSDEIASETAVIHPAFLPTTMQVLAA